MCPSSRKEAEKQEIRRNLESKRKAKRLEESYKLIINQEGSKKVRRRKKKASRKLEWKKLE